MPEEPRRPIMGEIVSVEEGGGEVRLASGEVGWLPRPMDAKLQEKALYPRHTRGGEIDERRQAYQA